MPDYPTLYGYASEYLWQTDNELKAIIKAYDMPDTVRVALESLHARTDQKIKDLEKRRG